MVDARASLHLGFESEGASQVILLLEDMEVTLCFLNVFDLFILIVRTQLELEELFAQVLLQLFGV